MGDAPTRVAPSGAGEAGAGEAGAGAGGAGASGSGTAAAGNDDGDLVGRARAGDTSAFAELFRRHHRGVYRTLLGITGSAQDAEDAVQNAFVKAYEHLDQFQGTARFSTWLTRIAINDGLARLRERGRLDALDAAAGDDEGDVIPRHLRAWGEDPEFLRSKAQARELVERAILALPRKYRVAVLLRDIQQLSAEEAAQALGLGVPTLKTHLLRGRLLLREALAPHFAPPRRTTDATGGRS